MSFNDNFLWGAASAATQIEGAFRDCPKLRYFYGYGASVDHRALVIDNVLIAIGPESCPSCLFVPDGITRIGKSALTNCRNLEQVVLSNTVTSIGEYAFDGCGLRDISFPESLTTIEPYAFGTGSILDLSLPASVTSIGGQSLLCVTHNLYINSIIPPTIVPYDPTGNGRYLIYAISNANIFVPADYVETYRAAEGWKTFASRIQATPEP